MPKLKLWLLLGLALLVAGCAARAADEFAKLKPGMREAEVRQVLGDPVAVRTVRFSGHDEDYLVWEYLMVPDDDLCPSEAASRVVTGIVTLGLSEIAWSNAKAVPHWVYFLDGMMVYTSKAFDCDHDEICTYTGRRK